MWPPSARKVELARRPAAGAGSDVALGHEAALDQLADPLGDDRPPETGPGDELGAAPRPPEPDLVEHDDERVERLVRQRARNGAHGRPAVGSVGALGPCRDATPFRARATTFALDMRKYDAWRRKPEPRPI